jgi:signal transduction histidine kinase
MSVLYRHLAEKHGISFRFEAASGIAPAWLDHRGLHSCLANLVQNAFEACRGSRGVCVIALRVLEQAEVLRFEVEDNGCGIEPEVLDRLFRGIFTSKGPSGTGLGLVMTKKIVEDHGGTIAVESSPGRGTRFRIELPRSRLPAPNHESGGPGPAEED